MNTFVLPSEKDPMGRAIADFYKSGRARKLRVFSSLFEEDEIPVSQLFRTEQQMPAIEREALQLAHGRILDVGAGSGCHSLALQEAGKEVMAIDISPLSVEVMQQRGVQIVRQVNLFDDSEFLDIYNPAEPDNDNATQFYFGRLSDGSRTEKHWTAITEDLSVCIVANSKENCSDQFRIALDNLLRTVRRFWLQNELGL